MNRLLAYIRGYLVIIFRGASPQWVLNMLVQQKVPFWNIIWIDEFTVSVCIGKKRYDVMQMCIEKCMCEHVACREQSLFHSVGGLLQRPVLLFFLVLSVVAVTLIPQFILFYQVTGNVTVPDEMVLRALKDIGVDFGYRGILINPQWIKNHVLNTIPDLEWVTVTQNGCRAQVVVRERTHKPDTTIRKGYANVIATQSGILTKQDVLCGQPLYQIGDTVAKGDILVSGLVDLERTVAIVRADAEIYARTWRSIEAVTPQKTKEKAYTGKDYRSVWLEIGEKRIKIYGNSGISGATCDKIINKSKLELPGGLSFPISLIVEDCVEYRLVPVTVKEELAKAFLTQYLRERVVAEMVAGVILAENYDVRTGSGCYTVEADLECQEMIASIVDAKWEQEEIFHDRTIRERGTDGTDH